MSSCTFFVASFEAEQIDVSTPLNEEEPLGYDNELPEQ
jgi:hypothetical protein